MGPSFWMILNAAVIVMVAAVMIAVKFAGGRNARQPASEQPSTHSVALVLSMAILLALAVLGTVVFWIAQR